VRDPVSGADGIPVAPFASLVDLPAGADPIDALIQASVGLRESTAVAGDGRDYPLQHSIGRRGYWHDPDQAKDHLVYTLIVGCKGGGAQLFILDTTRDTEAQLDGELRHIIQSLREP
jgi:hypothetical protein